MQPARPLRQRGPSPRDTLMSVIKVPPGVAMDLLARADYNIEAAASLHFSEADSNKRKSAVKETDAEKKPATKKSRPIGPQLCDHGRRRNQCKEY